MMALTLGRTVAGFAAEIAVAFAIGVATGTAYHLLLWRSVQILAGNGSPAKVAVGQVARLLTAAVAFTVAARYGALPLLAALLGFSIVRMEAVRRIRLPS